MDLWTISRKDVDSEPGQVCSGLRLNTAKWK